MAFPVEPIQSEPYNPYNLTVPTFSDGEASKDLYYSEFLENNELWVPFVKAVCEKHSLSSDEIKGVVWCREVFLDELCVLVF